MRISRISNAPAESAVAIFEIMVGLRLKSEEATERDNYREAIVGDVSAFAFRSAI